MNRVHQLGGDERRETERGFVQQEHRRLGDERPGHRQHLAFAAREFRGVLLTTFTEHRELHVLLFETLLQVDLGRHRAETQILLDGELADDASSLGHVADAQSRDVLGPFAHEREFAHADRSVLRLFRAR